MKSIVTRLTICIAAVWTLSECATSTGWCWAGARARQESAQSAESSNTDSPSGQSQVAEWVFGIEVTATGGARSVTVVFPVPQEWPEQKVVWSEPELNPPTGQWKTQALDGVTLVTVKWPTIAANSTASIRIPAQIEKTFVPAPKIVESFRGLQSGPGKLRAYLQPSPYIESSHRRIKELAAELPVDAALPMWQQVEQIYDWVRETIEYRFDTKIKSCLAALDDGFGDCEEMSSLFIALCRARGIPARAVWIPEHTYAEFYLEDAEGQGHWFPCQLAGTRQFGEMQEAKPVLQKGDKFKIPGNSQPLRYAQPTLVAEQVQGDLKLKWIAEVVDPKQ